MSGVATTAELDTIIACASGDGACSPSALIRVSGDAVGDILHRIVLTSDGPHDERDRWCAPVTVLLPAGRFRSLAMHWPRGRSYTGQRTLELLVPGNPHLVIRTLGALRTIPGVRQAEPGEFSARAYHAGRITLTQAEGLAAVIAAANDAQLAAARAALRGDRGRQYTLWAERIATLLALVEAGVDFTDQEDVRAIEHHDLLAGIESLIDDVRSQLAGRRGVAASARTPRVCLFGAPNAGKSTLFNTLLHRPRAIVSPIAGTTRDALTEQLTLTGPAGRRLDVTLSDLPGIGDIPANGSHGASDHAAMVRAAESASEADVVIWCDPSGRFDPSESPRIEQARVIRVRTKCDLAAGDADGMKDMLRLCAIDHRGVDSLRRRLFDVIWHGTARADALELLPRHQIAVHAMLETLDRLASSLRSEGTRHGPEVTAHELRIALDAIGELTGRVERDEIIGRIFATFCIGK